MTWYAFLTGLPPAVGAGLIVSLGLKGLHTLSDLLRRGETVTEEVLLEELHGCNAEALDWLRGVWARVERTQANTTEILDRLESLTDSVRKLDQTAQSDPDTDRDAVLFLGNRLQEVLDAVQAADERQAEQLQDIRSGLQLVLPANFTVVRDLDQEGAAHRLMRALDLHPEDVYLDRLVQRPEVLNQAPAQGNVLVTGIPGAGKTTLIHQILMREQPDAVVIAGKGFGSHPDHTRRLIVEDLPQSFTLVYDNIQFGARDFHAAVGQLQAAFDDRMRVLCACRSGDLPNVEHPQVTGDFRSALHIGHEAHVPELSQDEAEQVVALCESSWDIQVDPQCREWLVEKGGKAYATPFYFISMLAPIREDESRTAHLHDLLTLPDPDEPSDAVLFIWQRYFEQLKPHEQDLLRAIRIAWDMQVVPHCIFVSLLCEGVFGRDRGAQREARDRLKRLLWLSVGDDRYSCYGLQIQAVQLTEGDHDLFVQWALNSAGRLETRLLVLAEAGVMQYYRHPKAADEATREAALGNAVRLFLAGAEACQAAEEQEQRAGFLNNISNTYSELAASADSEPKRQAILHRAVAAVEEAIAIWRRVDLPPDLSMGLINLSIRYSDLATAAQSRADRGALLQKAVAAIEEAIGIRRALDRPAEVANALNNASAYYRAMSKAAERCSDRRRFLEKAVSTIQEAIDIWRRLNLSADLAGSLNNASGCYSALAAAAESREERRELLQKAVDAIEEAVAIWRRLNRPADLAMSLNNASKYYLSLAGVMRGRVTRRARLNKAVAAIEEAISIQRRLNLPAALAMSLNNCASCYSTLAAARSPEQRRGLLAEGIAAVEEAVAINRQLNLLGDLAMSLTNASDLSFALAAAADTRAERLTALRKAVADIEAAMRLYRKLDLPADLGRCLRNAGTYYSHLGAALSSAHERWLLLDKAIAAVGEAVVIFQRLELEAWPKRAVFEAARGIGDAA